MKKITVCGGAPLCGEIDVSGSKNAALPIIFACTLTKGVSEIKNLPDIGDVRVALDLLCSFGAKVSFASGVAYIDTTSLSYSFCCIISTVPLLWICQILLCCALKHLFKIFVCLPTCLGQVH